MKRTIKNIVFFLLIAAVSFTACKNPNDDTTEQQATDQIVDLSGKGDISATAYQVRQKAKEETTKSVILKSKEDFQDMEKEVAATLTGELKKLFNEINQSSADKLRASGVLNFKSVNTADSLTLTILGYSVKPTGSGIVTDPCAALQTQLEGLLQDSINGAKDMYSAIGTALNGIEADFWSQANRLSHSKANAVDSALWVVATIEFWWTNFGNPFYINGAEIQALYNTCKAFISKCEQLATIREQVKNCVGTLPQGVSKKE